MAIISSLALPCIIISSLFIAVTSIISSLAFLRAIISSLVVRASSRPRAAAAARRPAARRRPPARGPGPFAKLLNEFVSQRSYFLLAELIMARRNASELIMAITAMNNELIMARRNASEFIMAISAMNNIFITLFCFCILCYF